MAKTITVTEMARSFSDFIGRVYYKQEEFNIKKGVNIVARLSPIRKLEGTKIQDLNNILRMHLALIKLI